ncbi:MAG: RNA 2',3'-cyclic phosphodiesterase [Wenzhouxiangellaceae bacterium]
MNNSRSHRRLFFALWPSPEIRAGIVRRRELINGLSRRRVPDHNLHLTLLFLGDQPADRVPRIVDAAGELRAPAFDLLLDRFGWYARARVAWLGGPAPAGGQALAAGLTARMDALELAFDRRPWAPHVTLFRKVAKRPEPPAVEPLDWPVSRFVLIESVPGKPYEPLASFELE